MSKSQAIESIMKIFLMIAVIIVGMSFLLKAFGIDIFGWLKEKFEGFDIPSDGKALHVALDKAHFLEGNQLWEFHLTDGEWASLYREKQEGNFFTFAENDKNLVHPANIDSKNEAFFMLEPDATSAGKCILLLTDEEDTPGATDRGAIFYINPGTVIQEGCGNNGDTLYDCIKDSLTDANNFAGCRTNILNKDRLPWEFGFYNEESCLFANECGRAGDSGDKLLYCWKENTDQHIDWCKEGGTAYKLGSYYVPKSVKPSANPNFHSCAVTKEPKGSVEISKLKETTVLGIPFSQVIDNGKSVCGNYGVCKLLKVNPDNKYAYQVKYGLLCAKSAQGEAKWKVCKQSDKPIIGNDGNKDYECNFITEVGKWNQK